MNRGAFKAELQALINRHSIENGSDTPDYILTDFLMGCLEAFEAGIARREGFYGREVRGGKPVTITPVDEAYVKQHYKLDYGPRDEFVEMLQTVKILELLEIRKQAQGVNDEYTLKACDDELRRREKSIGRQTVVCNTFTMPLQDKVWKSFTFEATSERKTQAMKNHGGQPLERLAARGGMNLNEMLAIVLCHELTEPIPEYEAIRLLKENGRLNDA